MSMVLSVQLCVYGRQIVWGVVWWNSSRLDWEMSFSQSALAHKHTLDKPAGSLSTILAWSKPRTVPFLNIMIRCLESAIPCLWEWSHLAKNKLLIYHFTTHTCKYQVPVTSSQTNLFMFSFFVMFYCCLRFAAAGFVFPVYFIPPPLPPSPTLAQHLWK